jgi:hypothetical protein
MALEPTSKPATLFFLPNSILLLLLLRLCASIFCFGNLEFCIHLTNDSGFSFLMIFATIQNYKQRQDSRRIGQLIAAPNP